MSDDYQKRWSEHTKTLKEANAMNKVAVFDALQTAKIKLVEVEFDGEGDSGGITDIHAYGTEQAVADIPSTRVSLQLISLGEVNATVGEQSLKEAIEVLCFDYLGQEGHSGWENNDGAYGTFRFDVAKRTIELEFNARFTDTSTTTYEF